LSVGFRVAEKFGEVGEDFDQAGLIRGRQWRVTSGE
jgi:hypothetical protein